MNMFEYFDECKKGLPIPLNWVDVSYYNATCPCFEVYINKQNFVIYLDHENEDLRDFGNLVKRFRVYKYEDKENENFYDDFSYQTDNFNELLNFINKLS